MMLEPTKELATVAYFLLLTFYSSLLDHKNSPKRDFCPNIIFLRHFQSVLHFSCVSQRISINPLRLQYYIPGCDF